MMIAMTMASRGRSTKIAENNGASSGSSSEAYAARATT
jgi:hypothetical protein